MRNLLCSFVRDYGISFIKIGSIANELPLRLSIYDTLSDLLKGFWQVFGWNTTKDTEGFCV